MKPGIGSVTIKAATTLVRGEYSYSKLYESLKEITVPKGATEVTLHLRLDALDRVLTPIQGGHHGDLDYFDVPVPGDDDLHLPPPDDTVDQVVTPVADGSDDTYDYYHWDSPRPLFAVGWRSGVMGAPDGGGPSGANYSSTGVIPDHDPNPVPQRRSGPANGPPPELVVRVEWKENGVTRSSKELNINLSPLTTPK